MAIRAVFVTVMPSPYQRELFGALHSDRRLDIQVFYCTESEIDRQWSRPQLYSYEKVVAGRTLESLGKSAHFNPSMVRELDGARPDVTILSDYSAPTTQVAMRYLSWRGMPWIFWGELPGLTQRGVLGNLVRSRLQAPIGRAAAIAAIGNGAARAYEKLFSHVPVSCIPYFCDLKPFIAAASERQSERRAGPMRILFSGQIIERKGIDILIRAFAKAVVEAPNIRLEILGTGRLLGAMQSLAVGELRERISFLGFKQPRELPEIFAACDVFVLPSRHDGWGVVVNEALGAGLSLVVSDRVGARDLVSPGVNGFVVTAGDVDGLASVLVQLANSDEVLQAQQRASASMAAQWDVDEGVRRWHDLVSRVVAAHRSSTTKNRKLFGMKR